MLDGRYRDEILTGCDQVGLRGLLAAHADDVFELPVSNSAVLSDMDYPEDYQRELARLPGNPSDARAVGWEVNQSTCLELSGLVSLSQPVIGPLQS